MGFYHLVFLLLSSLCNDAAGAFVNNTCKASEREALLLFKRSNVVKDHNGLLSSWVGSDCCRNWTGVLCDNHTGHVIKLRVDYHNHEGMVPVVPPQTGNLTHLKSLTLHGFRIEGGWIARLTSLEYLRLQSMNLRRAPDFIYNLNMLPSISKVNITACSVLIPRSLQQVNFTRLSSLTIDGNNIDTRMPHWLFNITTLTYLSMSDSNVFGSIPSGVGNLHNLETLFLNRNKLMGSIPETLGGLRHLSVLSLRQNNLVGSIPSSFRNLTSLTVLGFSHNRLNGSMPQFIANLTNLEMLLLHENNLHGALTDSYFDSLNRLYMLDLSANPLEIIFSSDWNPPFELYTLGLAFCRNIGPSFPRWIRSQSGLGFLNLSNSGISGVLPTWLWDLSSIDIMDLTGNNLSGTIPSKALDNAQLYHLFLANNHIEGPLPQLKNANNLNLLVLSNNSFSGRIPISYCELKGLDVLDLSTNHLSGRIPRCLQKLERLSILNLASNKLDGSIEGVFNSSCNLQIVALNDNNFSGDFPSSLRRCPHLRLLNIGQNKISGNLPAWISTSAPLLSALFAGSNKLHGEIPQDLHLLGKLQILDLSNNKFSGSIPHGVGNFNAMKESSTLRRRFREEDMFTFTIYLSSNYLHFTYGFTVTYSAFIITKGQRMEYSRLLALMVLIDLSNNELGGEIPRELCNLLGLKSLNLSSNHLVGKIPDNINALRNMESLDFSFNSLHGKIPQSMLDMSFLSELNLSYNNLSGKIPSGSQFFTFNSSSYIGNAELCGIPLPKLCDDSRNLIRVPDGKLDDQNYIVFVYLSVALGFIFGFWALYFTLWFKRTWSDAYFQIIDDILEKIYEATNRSYSRSEGYDDT